jgi:hypothetical protein
LDTLCESSVYQDDLSSAKQLSNILQEKKASPVIRQASKSNNNSLETRRMKGDLMYVPLCDILSSSNEELERQVKTIEETKNNEQFSPLRHAISAWRNVSKKVSDLEVKTKVKVAYSNRSLGQFLASRRVDNVAMTEIPTEEYDEQHIKNTKSVEREARSETSSRISRGWLTCWERSKQSISFVKQKMSIKHKVIVAAFLFVLVLMIIIIVSCGRRDIKRNAANTSSNISSNAGEGYAPPFNTANDNNTPLSPVDTSQTAPTPFNNPTQGSKPDMAATSKPSHSNTNVPATTPASSIQPGFTPQTAENPPQVTPSTQVQMTSTPTGAPTTMVVFSLPPKNDDFSPSTSSKKGSDSSTAKNDQEKFLYGVSTEDSSSGMAILTIPRTISTSNTESSAAKMEKSVKASISSLRGSSTSTANAEESFSSSFNTNPPEESPPPPNGHLSIYMIPNSLNP